jgi:hypothetical protein
MLLIICYQIESMANSILYSTLFIRLYSVSQPISIVFFMFSYLMYKYQLLYVYINDYQSGGYMWYAVFNR